jgi:hypothetical protein
MIGDSLKQAQWLREDDWEFSFGDGIFFLILRGWEKDGCRF